MAASALSVNFRPLGGVQGRGAPCYLLQVDDFTFLIDCGVLEEPGAADGEAAAARAAIEASRRETERQLEECVAHGGAGDTGATALGPPPLWH